MIKLTWTFAPSIVTNPEAGDRFYEVGEEAFAAAGCEVTEGDFHVFCDTSWNVCFGQVTELKHEGAWVIVRFLGHTFREGK